MSERFIQRSIDFSNQISNGFITVEKLCELIIGHDYELDIHKAFDVNSILNDKIVIENIDVVFNKIIIIKNTYKYFKIGSQSNKISFRQGGEKVEGISDVNPLIFLFEEYNFGGGDVLNDLEAYALYEAKSSYFEEFSMSKYANMLFDNNFADLANINLSYFKKASSNNEKLNKKRSFRLVENAGEVFLRGITSDNYNEYGIDFTFVVAMLLFHRNMKLYAGNNFKISFAAVNESKLDFIISSDKIIDAGDFGKVSSAISISTNDVGKGAVSFVNIIKLHTKGSGVYLYPKNKELIKKDVSIIHTTGMKKTLDNLLNMQDFYNYSDLFLKELNTAKNIKTPDDLRARIFVKCQQPNSSFKDIKELKDIFSKVINNEISDFAKLLEMCNKAEELDINYDLKEKLRGIISQIILN